MGEERLQAPLFRRALNRDQDRGAMKPGDLARVIDRADPRQSKNINSWALASMAKPWSAPGLVREAVEARANSTGRGAAPVNARRQVHDSSSTRLPMSGHQLLDPCRKRALRKLKTPTFSPKPRKLPARSRAIPGSISRSFAQLLSLARRVRDQERGQRGPKVYSLHAPEVECIGNQGRIKPCAMTVRCQGKRSPPPFNTASP